MPEGRKVCLIYSVFCIANNQAVKVPEGKRFYLAYLIACIVSKQVVKVSKNKKVHLTYLVVYIDELCHQVSKGRKVHLIYLVFCTANSKNRKNIKKSNPSDLCKVYIQRDI